MENLKKWVKNNIDLGVIKQNRTYNLQFESIEELDIDTIHPKCGTCTTILGYKDKILKVRYTSSTIPTDIMLLQGYLLVKKGIVITYRDGLKEELYFIAKIVK